MKPLNFNVKEILPSLLDHSKTQTIRKAWEEVDKQLTDELNEKIIQKIAPDSRIAFIGDKPPKYKVGDQVDIVWTEDNKFDGFCKICGNGIGPWTFNGKHFCCKCKKDTEVFSKNLGKVEIIEAFKIGIYKDMFVTKNNTPVSNIWGCYKKTQMDDLAKRDGFKSWVELHKVLDNLYDLNSQKPFYVYRWKWL